MVGEEVSKDMQRLDNLGGVGGHSKDRQEVGAYSKCNEKSPEGCNKERLRGICIFKRHYSEYSRCIRMTQWT